MAVKREGREWGRWRGVTTPRPNHWHTPHHPAPNTASDLILQSLPTASELQLFKPATSANRFTGRCLHEQPLPTALPAGVYMSNLCQPLYRQVST